MIPCMLFTKCAATLAANRSLVLIALPLTAVLQVMSLLVLSVAAASCLCIEPSLQHCGFAFEECGLFMHLRFNMVLITHVHCAFNTLTCSAQQ